MRCLKIIFLSTSLLRNNIPVLGGPARLHLPTLAGPFWHCMSTVKTVGAIANLFMTAQWFVFKQVFRMSLVDRTCTWYLVWLMMVLGRMHTPVTCHTPSIKYAYGTWAVLYIPCAPRSAGTNRVVPCTRWPSPDRLVPTAGLRTATLCARLEARFPTSCRTSHSRFATPWL